eukprot:scaffold356305_cov31-Attheya_sp.AAC.1
MRLASNGNKPFASWSTMSGSNVDCLPVMGSTTLSHSTRSDRDHDDGDHHRQHYREGNHESPRWLTVEYRHHGESQDRTARAASD